MKILYLFTFHYPTMATAQLILIIILTVKYIDSKHSPVLAREYVASHEAWCYKDHYQFGYTHDLATNPDTASTARCYVYIYEMPRTTCYIVHYKTAVCRLSNGILISDLEVQNLLPNTYKQYTRSDIFFDAIGIRLNM